MKPRLPISFSRRRGSFTLVELLVSMVILSLILIGLATMMSFVTRTWLAGINSADNFTKARTLLTVLDRDAQMVILRRDVAAFTDNTGTNAVCAFYTTIQGNPATGLTSPDTRAISLVKYSLVQLPTAATATSSVLQRLTCGMNFVTNNPSSITNVTPTVGYSTNLIQTANYAFTNVPPENISTGVVAFHWQFIDGSGTILTPPFSLSSTPAFSASNLPPYYASTPPASSIPFWFDYYNPSASYNPRTLVVSMVVVCNNAYKLAMATGTLGTLITNFPSPASGLPADMPTITTSTGTYATETYAQYWNSKLNPSNGTFGAGLPAPVHGQGAIMVFERHIPLPINP